MKYGFHVEKFSRLLCLVHVRHGFYGLPSCLLFSVSLPLFLSFCQFPVISLSVSSLHVLVEKHGITLHVLVESSIIGDFSFYFYRASYVNADSINFY